MRRPRQLALPARRDFLIGSAAATLAGMLGCGDNRTRPPANSRLGIGLIGVGGFGSSDWILGSIQRNPMMQLVAIADYDATHRDAITAALPDVASYVDYQDLIARDDIDAVYIITPHHQHAPVAIHAARAGKHIYCEKPLSLTIAEGRAMANAARENDIAFQTGSQQRSMPEFLLACEVARNGRLGQITDVDVVLGFGPTHAPEPAMPIPETLEWDRWLGPAPDSPYHQLKVHTNFRYFHDYGGGMATDIGAHMIDIAQWGLGRDRVGPDTVRATATYGTNTFFEEPTAIDGQLVYGGIPVHLYTDFIWGVTFRGTEGEVFVTRGTIQASRAELLDWEIGSGDVVLEQSLDHHQNWVDAIYNGTRACADVEIGHRTATTCHLVNIALRTGRTITWDAQSEHIVGDADADAMLSRPSRPGYAF